MGIQKKKTKNKPKCSLGMFRKENRLVSFPKCLGLFNPDDMHRSKQNKLQK